MKAPAPPRAPRGGCQACPGPRSLGRRTRAALAGELAAAMGLLLAFLPACGKRGDPLPPLRKTPQPVSSLRAAQRGERVELTGVAPRASTDGLRLPVLDVEILRADAPGDFARVARRTTLKAAPGETLVVVEPLPLPPATLRFAARAIAAGRASTLTPIVTLRIQPPPPAPADLEARLTAEGVALRWTAPAARPGADPPSLPPGSSSPSPSPAAGAPPPAASSTAAAKEPPPPKPSQGGFWVYRRPEDGRYDRPLSRTPAEAPAFDDKTAATGVTSCYTVRTVVSTDPIIESEASEEACLEVRDIVPPAAPTGLAALPREGGIELSWSPSPEPDLAEYRIYRANLGGPSERLHEVPAGQARFDDASLARGIVLVYTLTALDRAGNESPPSASAEARWP